MLKKILLKQAASIDLHSLSSEACAVWAGAHLPVCESIHSTGRDVHRPPVHSNSVGCESCAVENCWRGSIQAASKKSVFCPKIRQE